jgi:hypothetical protein
MDIQRGKLYAVITGDIVGSTKFPEDARVQLHNIMIVGANELRQAFLNEVSEPIDIFSGDSWQLMVSVPASALKIALFYRAFLRAQMKNIKVDTRLAIAIGTIDFFVGDRISNWDGEVFQKSGRLLRQMKHVRMGFVFSGKEKEDFHLALETIVELLDTLASSWTEKQAQAIN